MLRLIKAFVKTDNRLLPWAVWLLLTVSVVLIYGFAVGDMISVACLCVLWCVVSAADILLSARSRDNTFPWKVAYALLKGFGAVLLAIILYTTVNRISPTLVNNYETFAKSVEYSRGGTITVTFTDPDGQSQTGEMPDYGCLRMTIRLWRSGMILQSENTKEFSGSRTVPSRRFRMKNRSLYESF